MTDIQIMHDGPLVKKADAKAAGITLYFTGNSCKWGHVDQRWTCSSRCKSCQRASTDSHIKENSEKYKEMARKRSREKWKTDRGRLSEEHNQWRLKNLKSRAKYLRDWRVGKEKEYNKYQRDWRKSNPDKVREHNKTFRENNPETVRACNVARRSRELGAEGRFTSRDVKLILEIQSNKCAEPTCGVDLSDGYHVDHIMPLSKGGSNWPSNLQCLCPRCNLRKGAKNPIDWAQENGRLL